MVEQDPFVTQYVEELDRRLAPQVESFRQQLDEVFKDADAKLIALGSLLSPGYRPSVLAAPDETTPLKGAAQEQATELKERYASDEEALSAGIAHFLDMPEGKRALNAKALKKTTVDHGALARALDNWRYSRNPEEVAIATLEQQRFTEAVGLAKPGAPVLIMSHCTLWAGVIGENPTVETINRATAKGEGPHLRGRGVNVPGYEVWFYGGQQGESSIKYSDEIEFFTQGQVITDNDIDRIDEIITSGSWWDVHNGVQIVGEKAVNTFLERLVKEDFEPVGENRRGWKKHKKSLVDSTSTLAISLLRQQGYDWLGENPTEDQEHTAQLVDSTFKASVANLVSGMVIGKGHDLFYAPRLGTRVFAWNFKPSDRGEIRQHAIGMIKESDTYEKLKHVADTFDGDVEQFVESTVNSFLANILGLTEE